MTQRSELDLLYETVDEIREYAHRLGARQIVATMPTFDGEAVIDYRPDDWLKISLPVVRENPFVLPPDWSPSK